MRIKHYFRYADNIIVLGETKEQLRKWLTNIKHYFNDLLKLEIKPDWQIYDIEIRGIDFVGYVFRHTHTLLRKCIKMRMWRMINRYLHNKLSILQLKRKIASYLGWLKYCNSKHLLSRIKELVHIDFSNWRGIRTTFKSIYNKSIKLIHIEIRQSYCLLQFIYRKKPCFITSKNFNLCMELKKFEGMAMALGYK